MPTSSFDPVAPGVTVEQCLADLTAADADGNQSVSQQEFAAFLTTFGARVCYERPADSATTLTETESPTFDNLICLGLTTQECTGKTEIGIANPPFTTPLAYTLCTVTYAAAMGGSTCDGATPATVAPTGAPGTTQAPVTTSAPSVAPIQPRSGAAMVGGNMILCWTVTGTLGMAMIMMFAAS